MVLPLTRSSIPHASGWLHTSTLFFLLHGPLFVSFKEKWVMSIWPALAIHAQSTILGCHQHLLHSGCFLGIQGNRSSQYNIWLRFNLMYVIPARILWKLIPNEQRIPNNAHFTTTMTPTVSSFVTVLRVARLLFAGNGCSHTAANWESFGSLFCFSSSSALHSKLLRSSNAPGRLWYYLSQKGQMDTAIVQYCHNSRKCQWFDIMVMVPDTGTEPEAIKSVAQPVISRPLCNLH